MLTFCCWRGAACGRPWLVMSPNADRFVAAPTCTPNAPYLQPSVGHHEVGGHLGMQEKRQQAFGASRTSSACPRLLPIVPARVRPVAKPAPISAASLKATTTALTSAIVPLADPL